jgi:hypothetical protein
MRVFSRGRDGSAMDAVIATEGAVRYSMTGALQNQLHMQSGRAYNLTATPLDQNLVPVWPKVIGLGSDSSAVCCGRCGLEVPLEATHCTACNSDLHGTIPLTTVALILQRVANRSL